LERRWLSWLRRRWLLCLIVAGSIVLAAQHSTEIKQVLVTLLHGQLQWVLVAVLLQVVCFVLYAALYQLSFLTVEVESRWGDLVPLLFASICLKTMVPSGGVSGVALFVDDAARRGQSSARAAQGALLVLAADLVTMTPLLLYGLIYLSSRGALQPYQAAGVAGFLAFAGGVAAMLLVGRRWPHVLHIVLNGLQEAVNGLGGHIGRPALLAGDWARRNADEFAGAAAGIATHPRRLGRTLALALAIHLVDVAGLYALFLAYRQPVSVGAVMVGFGMDVVFSVLTFIPHGIGVAEGVVTLALTSLGVPAAKALVVALVARGLNIWLPFFPGLLFLRHLRAFGAGR
jgi:uncharacterized membrane protein YbhN (UPF0104 family)